MKAPAIGDYVLATKYTDGDPGDQFSIGFYDRPAPRDRFLVVDSEGKQFRCNGFRRIQKISDRRGRWLIARIKEIERSSRSLWWWVRQPMGSADAPAPRE